MRLRAALGNVCSRCPAVHDLDFHCIVPQGQDHHKLESSMRASFYLRQARMGNLQLMCKKCHQAHHTQSLCRVTSA